jgi:hypothetical protein
VLTYHSSLKILSLRPRSGFDVRTASGADWKIFAIMSDESIKSSLELICSALLDEGVEFIVIGGQPNGYLAALERRLTSIYVISVHGEPGTTR